MRVPANWNFCLAMLREVAPANGSPFYAAEIGCASGGNAASMLRAFPTLCLWMIDPWRADPEYVTSLKATRGNSPYLAKTTLDQPTFDKWYREAVSATEFAGHSIGGRCGILRHTSMDGARCIADSSLSFAFIDGDHREEAVAADLRAWWSKIQTGGIFSGHDYGTRGHDGVKRAVDAWAKEVGVEVLLDRSYPRCWRVNKA